MVLYVYNVKHTSSSSLYRTRFSHRNANSRSMYSIDERVTDRVHKG